MKRYCCVVGAAVLTLGSLPAISISTAYAQGLIDMVVAPGENPAPFGKSYGDLAGEWWQWGVDTEFGAFGEGAVDCTLGQEGRVWFLAGTFGNPRDEPVRRSCTIPPGKAIFFPIVNALSFTPDFPEDGNVCLPFGVNIDGVRCDANDDIGLIQPPSELSVVIDGEPVSDILAYRAQSGPGGFALRLPPESDPREAAVADGYWILLDRLEPGMYTIEFSACLHNGDDTDTCVPRFELAVEYVLTVSGVRAR